MTKIILKKENKKFFFENPSSIILFFFIELKRYSSEFRGLVDVTFWKKNFICTSAKILSKFSLRILSTITSSYGNLNILKGISCAGSLFNN